MNEQKANRFPEGWDEERVQDVLSHYLSQSQDDAVAEDEAAGQVEGCTLMQVPTELVPTVREIVARQRKGA